MRWFRKPMSASSNRFDPCILRILAEVNIGDRPQGKTFFVSPARFERATYCSASSCSIQLSYGLINQQSIFYPIMADFSLVFIPGGFSRQAIW